ncbi:MAG: HD domain-containing protein [Coriobacteriia bacterium]|nr:HD domain-containing protein [Coriobacteriia bacterium]
MTQDAIALVSALAAARRAEHLYPHSHPAYLEAVAALTKAVSQCVASGPCTIALYAGRLYHENAALAWDTPAVRTVAELLEARRVESLTFHPEVAQHELAALLEALAAKPQAGFDLAAVLEEMGVTGIAVGSVRDDEAEEAAKRDRLKEQDRALYQRLIALVRALSEQVAQRGEPDLEQAGILVEGVLARLMEDSAAVLGLTTLGSANEPSLFHAVNTMAYALVLGAELGIPEEGLAPLGISPLLHDLGKVAFDLSDPEQAKKAQVLHPVVGAEVLSRLPDADRTPMLVAFEHHMAPDGSGYPEREPGYVTHPYSRIVAVANRYDHLVTPRPHGYGLSRDQAVLQILKDGGGALDGMFARLLARAYGVFPVGCVVRLTDMSVGVVVAPGPTPLAPRVRILFEPDGTQAENGRVVELAASNESVVEVVDPASLALEVFENL